LNPFFCLNFFDMPEHIWCFPMIAQRKARYSVLFPNLVSDTGAVSFPLSDVFLADVMFYLHAGITYLSLYKHCSFLWTILWNWGKGTKYSCTNSSSNWDLTKSIFLPTFAGQRALNNDPIVWITGGRPPPTGFNGLAIVWKRVRWSHNLTNTEPPQKYISLRCLNAFTTV
jgi:hypothetical protein